jgi:hypothetical protein
MESERRMKKKENERKKGIVLATAKKEKLW